MVEEHNLELLKIHISMFVYAHTIMYIHMHAHIYNPGTVAWTPIGQLGPAMTPNGVDFSFLSFLFLGQAIYV